MFPACSIYLRFKQNKKNGYTLKGKNKNYINLGHLFLVASVINILPDIGPKGTTFVI